jgi:hypothetical protein
VRTEKHLYIDISSSQEHNINYHNIFIVCWRNWWKQFVQLCCILHLFRNTLQKKCYLSKFLCMITVGPENLMNFCRGSLCSMFKRANFASQKIELLYLSKSIFLKLIFYMVNETVRAKCGLDHLDHLLTNTLLYTWKRFLISVFISSCPVNSPGRYYKPPYS